MSDSELFLLLLLIYCSTCNLWGRITLIFTNTRLNYCNWTIVGHRNLLFLVSTSVCLLSSISAVIFVCLVCLANCNFSCDCEFVLTSVLSAIILICICGGITAAYGIDAVKFVWNWSGASRIVSIWTSIWLTSSCST